MTRTEYSRVVYLPTCMAVYTAPRMWLGANTYLNTRRVVSDAERTAIRHGKLVYRAYLPEGSDEPDKQYLHYLKYAYRDRALRIWPHYGKRGENYKREVRMEWHQIP